MKNIYAKYKRNENNNLHTENAVLLAKHFGTHEDLVTAKAIQSIHNQLGHIPYAFQQIRDEILIRLEKELKGIQTVKAQLSEPKFNYLGVGR